MSTPRPAPPSLRSLVRETLGCTCPDAVFDRVERTQEVAPASGAVFTRWVIGDRLLVYLVPSPGAPVGLAGELAALGRRDRDARGLNRFRLVLAAAPGGTDAHAVERAFAAAAGDDPKAHLHQVAAASCVGVLAGD